jgi:hypothetical protein
MGQSIKNYPNLYIVLRVGSFDESMAKISSQLVELKTMLVHFEQEHRQMITLLLNTLREYGMIEEIVQGDEHTFKIVPRIKEQDEKQ